MFDSRLGKGHLELPGSIKKPSQRPSTAAMADLEDGPSFQQSTIAERGRIIFQTNHVADWVGAKYHFSHFHLLCTICLTLAGTAGHVRCFCCGE